MLLGKKTNCPNCGAVIDETKHKCPYCGTLYYDMSFIEFDNGMPFFLKIKFNNMYITQFVKPNLNTMEISREDTYCTGKYGKRIETLPSLTTAITNISFNSIPF